MKKIFHENYELIYPEGAGAWQSFKYKKHLLDTQSEHQKIDVFDTEYGNVLCLDGIVQCTEMDEFIYHEMLTHVPMFEHPDPRRVLIVGGGDGGTLREVLKHGTVEDVTLVDLDLKVIEVGKKYFGAEEVFADPRVNVLGQDACKYIKKTNHQFDVCIIDCTDAGTTGGNSLYSRSFFASLTKRLSDNAAISMMAGVPMAQGLDHVREINKFMEFMGYEAKLYTTTVPSYYGGLTAMMFYQKDNYTIPRRPADGFDIKNYNPDIHATAFYLPKWLEDLRNGK